MAVRRDERPSRVFRRSRRYKAAAASVGVQVRELRRGEGWTLERASERMGLDFRHLQQIEAGSINITLATILRIADAFGVSVSVVLAIPPRGGSEDKAVDTNSKYGPRRAKVRRLPAIRAMETQTGRTAEAEGYLANPIVPPRSAEGEQRRVGAAVARQRHANHLTQAELAKRMRVSVQYIQRVEAGRQNLTIASLVRFANTLGVEPAWLFQGAG